MADYINRKDVMELLLRLKATAERMNDPTVNIAFAMRGIVDAAGAYEIVERLVGKLPSADVVPVVRCKDCELWNEWDRSGHESLNNLRCSCAHFSGEDGYTVYTAPNDFCSYGERKNNEEDI